MNRNIESQCVLGITIPTAVFLVPTRHQTGERHSRSGRSGEGKNLPPPHINPKFPSSVARRLVTSLAELRHPLGPFHTDDRSASDREYMASNETVHV
jgi:hypothetical protein